MNQAKEQKNNWFRVGRVVLFYVVSAILIAVLIGQLSGGSFSGFSDKRTEIALSELVTKVNSGEISQIVVSGDRLEATLSDGTELLVQKEKGTSVYDVFSQAGVENLSDKTKIEVKTPFLDGFWGIAIGSLLPVIIMVVFFLFLFKSAGKSGGGMFEFGKSNARLFSRNQSSVTFNDAAGVPEAKKELEEVVDFLKQPEKYRKLGARIPKGVLLVGPAGTGKTLLARAVANEAGVPFLSMAGSEFMEMLVGVGASRVRDLFAQAKHSAPSLIFIDEIETIGRKRGRSSMTSQGEQEQTLNQILVEMDGFTPNDNVIVLAATNRPDLLDNALVRPGRFDRQVALSFPDKFGRKEIIAIHAHNKPLSAEVDIDRLSQMTVGFSGADIENMLNESAILAASQDKSQIDMVDVNESISKVKLGRARNFLQSDEEKRMTAYHEAGHALVAKVLPGTDVVNRVSIVSRGMALGFTEINPEEDKYHQTRTDLLHRIAALLGGRAAEEIVYNNFTVGAHNDLDRASHIANKMVTEYGMSELGPVAFTYSDSMGDELFDPIIDRPRISNEMAAKIDNQIKKIIDESYVVAQEVLAPRRHILDAVVEVLMKNETIEKDEFDAIVLDNTTHE
ncbi:cell division protein FtsH [candidate division WWE3 bacterium CG_4_10_14_0_2_um_filter_41_14]|uniref:ATP-dependent zinc metalloprotease FtsH n=1 Tax=candidate division WWE3 bacterium CG_4_10_14_0_2_um_filter_41_14 TaxID=1975072 RepID=A0A2M7TI46_UNCKA|nr:MAG: cell division protein FtsH [candidate division WWE3 bacterium CG_4_10_14_0_2_um_filter_41_14]